MARDRNGSAREEEIGAGGDGEERGEEPSGRERRQKTKGRKEESSGDSSGDSDSERARGKKRKRKGRRSRGTRRRDADSESEEESSYSDSDSESETDSEGDSESDSESEAESEEILRRRKRKERRRKEREQEKERRRRKEKERERRRKREKEERRRRKERKKEKEKEKEKKKKKEKDTGTKGAVTNSWGKYGVIKETDMWNKRPEFSAWLAEVKQVNLETLSNWEEKQLFKQFMEDHNTATFPSKKYYSLDAYYRRKIENELKKGNKKVVETERINFNDEEQRRQELMLEREKQKAEKVEELKRSMQSGMAQAMKEQGRLREEMAYQYKLGNFEAAAAIQRRLDPDVPM